MFRIYECVRKERVEAIQGAKKTWMVLRLWVGCSRKEGWEDWGYGREFGLVGWWSVVGFSVGAGCYEEMVEGQGGWVKRAGGLRRGGDGWVSVWVVSC